MTVPEATEIAVLAMNAAAQMLAKAQIAGDAIAKAQAEGRAHLTDAEVQNIQQVDDVARTRLVDAIAKTTE